MSLDLTSRHIVITGGTGALGSAVVDLLLAAGATCHIPALHPPTTPARDRLHIQSPIDLTDEPAVTAFYASLPSLWASIHLAGGFTYAPIADTSLQTWHEMISINATTCFLCCREAIKKIRTTKDKEGGRIVNVAAKPALIPAPNLAAYAAGKAAVASLTLTLAEELAPENIWVNAIIPSLMDTPLNRQEMPHADFEKWPKLPEVAHIITFLASPQNQVTRSALIPVYGRS